jgi:acyl-CoA reductase-like NAD-dependent aldehyde dehydrogenase
MASRGERFKKAAVKAAKKAKQWAQVAAREADRLLAEAQKRAESEERQLKLKRALVRTGKVLKAVGRAAVVAGIAAGIAAARAENRARKATKKVKR